MDTVFKPEDVFVVLGHNIRITRERNGYGISELATKIGYDRNCLSAVEYGEQNLKYNTVLSIARVLNASFPALFSRNYQNTFENPDDGFSTYFIEDNYLLIFIENYLREMKSHQLNHIEVYADADVRPETVSRIIHKKVQNPTIKTLYAMAYTTGIDINKLFSRRALQGESYDIYTLFR